jgi:hypothetical protein
VPDPSGVIAVTFSKLNKAGFVIALLLGLSDLASPLQPTPAGEVGPPFGILLIDALLGLITIVAVIIGWRTARRGAVRIAAGARIVSMVTALPAFFAGVSTGILLIVSLFVVVTIACVALMLLPSRTPVPVLD